MKRYVNYEALLEGACYLLFSVMMIGMACSKKYLLFVTPRMEPYLYFTGIVMFIWAISRFLKAGTPKYKSSVSRCLVLMIPLMIILIPHGNFTSNAAVGGYLSDISGKLGKLPGGESPQAGETEEGNESLRNSEAEEGNESPQNSETKEGNVSPQAGETDKGNGAAQNSQTVTDTQPESDTQSKAQSQDSTPTAPGNQKQQIPAGLDEANRTITVSDEDFYNWLLQLSYYPDKYDGYQITMHGTVYRDDTLESNEFAVTRLLMSCCISDLAPCGPICIWDDATNLKQDKWVSVTGVFHYNKEKGIVIQVTGIEDAKKAEKEYVYPYRY
ncbi:TIGR03943 family putative permease subunit [uncultured Robinsoniella sp.]|uniref:TIGR03943 family putative permease subunit n=1 Tax=uncultured Robinsoniella sp. TaxID=904190 RepID=UPI00374F9F0A